MNITIKFTPRNVLEQNEVTMCEKSPELIGIEIPYDVQFRWNNGAALCCIRPEREGFYRLATYNECGSYVDTIKVKFSSCDTCVTIANAFTPNYDGRNDRFRPIIMCPVNEFSMQVFNRWGNKVFSTTNINDAWDGSYNGERCDLGIYIYVIRYRSSATNREKAMQGNVMLLR
jgi:gliding motility-associated-like protein